MKTRIYTACRHLACRHCWLDIEGFAPYRKGEWRDRGNNPTCPSGPRKGKPHAPYWAWMDARHYNATRNSANCHPTRSLP